MRKYNYLLLDLYSFSLILLYCCGSFGRCHYFSILSLSRSFFPIFTSFSFTIPLSCFVDLICVFDTHSSVYACACVFRRRIVHNALPRSMYFKWAIISTTKKPLICLEDTNHHHYWWATSHNSFIHSMSIEYEKWRYGVILWLYSHKHILNKYKVVHRLIHIL